METHQSHRSKRKRSDSAGSNDVDRSDERRPRTDSRETSSSDQEMAEAERVAILDAGAQYGKVIDRRVRELKVESVMLPLNTPADELRQQGFMALIISGSGNSINDPETCAMSYDRDIFSLGIPILGVCYGLHLICTHFGGVVETSQVREDGQFLVTLDTTCPLFQGMSPREKVLLTHGDFVHQVPSCLQEIGWSSNLITAVSHKSYPFFGIQFHPEVDLTEGGKKLLKNFLFEISGCQGLFELGSRQEKCLKFIKDRVGERKVLSLVSGGVDSTVCTLLLNKALGSEKVLPLHVDNGFMRLGEVDRVVASLKSLGISPHVMNAKLDFSSAHTIMDYVDLDNNRYRRATPRLVSAVNAEEKRHIIGDTFVKVAK